MIVTIKKEQKVDLKILTVSAGVRYWEDGEVNGSDDTDGTLIPCRNNDYWEPFIDIETGQITNWKTGTKAKLHYKVCDDGVYTVQDSEGNTVLQRSGYVPETMCPEGEGYGDYIIMQIDEKGFIERWVFHLDDFTKG